eukprot:217070-Rhodomonas_salina.1
MEGDPYGKCDQFFLQAHVDSTVNSNTNEYAIQTYKIGLCPRGERSRRAKQRAKNAQLSSISGSGAARTPRDRHTRFKGKGATMVYLDAFGGDPVVSSEVGAEPKDVDDPELLMPTGTCEMPGIELKECSHDCVYGCDNPMCTWGCVCACNTQGAKAKLLAFLSQQSRSTQVLAAQKDLSKAVTAMEVNAEQPKQLEGEGFLSNPFAGVKFPAKKKKGVNPRLEGHKLAKANQAKIARKIARQRKRQAEMQFVDRGNFDWSAYDAPHRKDPEELR